MNLYKFGTSNSLVYLDHTVSTAELVSFEGTADRDCLSNIMRNNIILLDYPVYLDEEHC